MLWLGRPAVALGLPAALSSIASVLMAAAAAALVTLGSYARRIDLHGLILPSAGLIQVSSPAAGWVQSMLVRDGQSVAAGTPLYLVNTDTANSPGNTQQQILQALASQRAILVDQIARKIELRNLQDATLRRKIENLQAQVRQMDAELAMQDEFVRRVTKDFEDFTRFQQQRLASLHDVLAQQGNWMRAKDEVERRKSDALGVQGQLIEVQSQLATNDLQIGNEVDAMRAKIAELDQQVATTETRHSIEIRAPGSRERDRDRDPSRPDGRERGADADHCSWGGHDAGRTARPQLRNCLPPPGRTGAAALQCLSLSAIRAVSGHGH